MNEEKQSFATQREPTDAESAVILADGFANCQLVASHATAGFDLEQSGYQMIIKALRAFASSETRLSGAARIALRNEAALAYDAHTHIAGGLNPDKCQQCGTDVRNPIHLRMGESRDSRINNLFMVPEQSAGSSVAEYPTGRAPSGSEEAGSIPAQHATNLRNDEGLFDTLHRQLTEVRVTVDEVERIYGGTP